MTRSSSRKLVVSEAGLSVKRGRPFALSSPYGLLSKLLEGGYIGDYIGE